MRDWTKCPVTGKIQYERKFIADLAVIKLTGKYNRPQRCYQCPHCHLWHLTAVPLEVFESTLEYQRTHPTSPGS